MLIHYFLVVSAMTVGLGLVSRRLRDVPMTEPMLGLAVGAALGPRALGYLDVPVDEIDLLLQLTRVLLAFTVMTAALRYPWEQVRRGWRPPTALIGIVLPLMAASGAVIAGTVLGLGWARAVLLGAILAPTDPVLVSSVVAGEAAEATFPSSFRTTLSLESGANDGFGFVFVATGLFFVQDHSGAWWALHAVGGVAGAIALGVAAGWATGRLVRWTRGAGQQTEATFLLFTLTFSLFVLAVCLVVGLDGIIAVFVAGLAYNRSISEDDRRRQAVVEEGVDRLLLLPVFVVIGAAAPWSGWFDLGWPAVLFMVAILLIRRIPWVLACGRLVGDGRVERAWLGWFGPIGVAALFYTGLSSEEGALDQELWAIVTLAVVVSTFIHGITAVTGRRLARRSFQHDLVP